MAALLSYTALESTQVVAAVTEADRLPDAADESMASMSGPPAGFIRTRSGIDVQAGEVVKALRLSAARDHANAVVREGSRKQDAEAVFEAFGRLGETAPRSVQDLIDQAKDEPFRWHVDRVIAHEAKVLLVAQAGAGKTTLIRDTAGSLVSGEKWLGHFEVIEPIDGNVVVVDAEMHPAMLADWYERAGWPEAVQRRVTPIPLVNSPDRAILLNLLDENVQCGWVAVLKILDAKALILDPAADFFQAAGLDEDAKGAWSDFQEAVDRICIQAGVGVRMIAHHTGWDTDRERGSSRARDWATTVVHLTKSDKFDNSAPRVIASPKGRDVVLPKGYVTLTEDGSRLVYEAAAGGRLTAVAGIDEGSLEWKVKVLDALAKAYPKGLDVTSTKAALGTRSSNVSKYLGVAERAGWATAEKDGKSTVFTITTSGMGFLDSLRGGDK